MKKLHDMIYSEKKKVEDKNLKEADEERAAADEEDKQARLACTFQLVQARYENGNQESGGVSPEKSGA